MSLSQGARLGPYTIGSLLGAGGMGEVYLARDGKLDRDVAIKVLRAEVVGDRERLARFEREARLLAALNHPNIANVIGLEDAGGTPALVMEFVDGPTLALRIDEGPLTLEEALEIARQIADALEAAHDRGIIHRDLKPANIKVRPDGIVKVLDFGLAKALDPFDPQGIADQVNSPTITSPAMTMRGVILGTAAYMSPEQAKGRPVDRRADLWACGCVLYEMLTGRRAFEGEDTTETIAAVVTKEPDWTALPPATPASIRRLLQRMLVKNPKQRFDSAAVLRLELVDAAAVLKNGPTERDARSEAGIRRRWLLVAVTGLLAAIGASLLTWAALPGPTRPAPAPVTRFALTLPSTQPLAQSFNASDIALSPQGTHLAYTVGLQSQLMVRALDQLDAVALEGIIGARAPFFSPDGSWLGYFDQSGELRRVSVAGGRPLAICKVDGTSRGASWGADDVIVFATSNSRGLLSVPAAGGTPTMLAAVGAGESAFFFPVVLPEGQGIVFTVFDGDGPSLAMLDRDGQRTALLREGSQAEFVEAGYLTYAADEALWAVRFSPASRTMSGAPVRVADVATSQVGPGVGANVAVSRHGTLAHVRAPRVQARALAWITRSGSESSIAAPVRRYSAPRLSPDGARLAVFLDDNDNFDIFTWELSRDSSAQTLMRITFAPMTDTYPVWSRDGRIIHSSVRDGSQNIYSRSADRSGTEERLTQGPSGERPLALSPDGRQLVFEENNTDTAWDLMRMQMDGMSTPVPLLRTTFDERNAALSPDGHWMAYESNETGQIEVFVRPFPNVDDAAFRISQSGGRSPVWSPAGGELFFVNGTTMYSVGVQLASTFRYASPVALFDSPSTLFDGRQALNGGAIRMYDVTSDGQRFVVVKNAETSDPAAARQSIVVVHNWFENATILAR